MNRDEKNKNNRKNICANNLPLALNQTLLNNVETKEQRILQEATTTTTKTTTTKEEKK